MMSSVTMEKKISMAVWKAKCNYCSRLFLKSSCILPSKLAQKYFSPLLLRAAYKFRGRAQDSLCCTYSSVLQHKSMARGLRKNRWGMQGSRTALTVMHVLCVNKDYRQSLFKEVNNSRKVGKQAGRQVSKQVGEMYVHVFSVPPQM